MGERSVVVGGGLAGITAALRLADAGHQVTLLDARPRLGGAAFSFRRGGLLVDNGQHVFLRCCTAYRALLDRLGASADTVLQPRLDIPVLSPTGAARIARTPGIPAPLHLARAMAGYRPLSLADRARLGRAVLALMRSDPADPALDRRSFGAFLREHGQSDDAIASLWSVIGTATLNARPDDASLALAVKVFRTGLLDRADAADIGHAVRPLGALHSDAAQRALAAAGVEVLLRHRAVRAGPGEVVASTGDGTTTFAADGVVLAVPAAALGIASRALPPQPALAAAPIVNVHLVYDRRVTGLSFAAAVHSPVQWFFDRTLSSGLREHDPRAQYLAVTVSAADAELRCPTRELVGRFTAAMAALLPPAAGASLVDAFVTREPRATFRQAPGTAHLRRGPATGVDGLALAGAWTATGWPDTMESAVRSGHAAADHLLAAAAARPVPATTR